MSSSEAQRQRNWLEAQDATRNAEAKLSDAIEAVVTARINEKELEAQLIEGIVPE